MLYLYDVWVNWFDGEHVGYNVCHYHEWRKKDNIDMIEQIPLLYITEPLYDYIENGLRPLPQQLLESIHKRTFIRKGYKRENIAYAAIVTDGNGVLAFDTIGYQIPYRKSRLNPRQEQQVYEAYQKLEKQDFSFLLPSETEKSEYIIDESYMIGLTRRERTLKQLLFIALKQLKTTKNKNEIQYWITEWNQQHNIENLQQRTFTQLWESLYEEVMDDWSIQHEKFGEQLIKNNPFLLQLWENEWIHDKNKENQK